MDKLTGVNADLALVVHRAIKITETDFAVIEGVRTLEQQKKLFQRGASQTMKSKHLDGLAVDLAAYVDGRLSWEMPFYFDIANAMQIAAIEEGVPIRWGGAWNIPDIRHYPDDMESAQHDYIELRRSQNRTPFLDGPHFELNP